MVSARLVAQYFLAQSVASGGAVTPLKLQKLVYYAYAHVLALTANRLFSEPIEAWQHGPVVPDLYHALKEFGKHPIGEEFLEQLSVERVEEPSGHFDFEVQFIMDGVFREYMPTNTATLREQTHVERPWIRAWNREGEDKRITDDDLLECFGPKLTVPRPNVVGELLKRELLSNESFVESTLQGLEEIEQGNYRDGEEVKRDILA